MSSHRLQTLVSLLSPLSLAAYAAWAAVWFSLEGIAANDPERGWIARGSALLFLIGFIAEDRLSNRFGPPTFAILAAVLAGLALVTSSQAPLGAAPILLVLLAAMLATRYQGLALWFWLLAINLGLAVVMWQFWTPSRYTWINWIGFASFQVFAALVMRYAAEAERAGEALRAANADLLATRSLLAESVRDSERLRLSRELHDVAGHKLTALKLNLAALARDPRFTDEAAVQLCRSLADELLADIRGVVQQMRQGDGLDLVEALNALARPFPRPRLQLEIGADARVTTVAHAEAVLRAVQEGLTNAVKHSQAQNLWVVLLRDDGTLRLDIRDDGRGSGDVCAGNGLCGMRERLEALGGGLCVGRTGTGGVHLQAWLPVTA